MAKRRSKEQIDADRIIKKELLKLGQKIYEQAVATSRRDTGRLQDEQNFRVQPDTQLNMFQVYYGAFNYPKGKNSGEKNALLIAVKEHIPEATTVIVDNLMDELTGNYGDTK